MNLSMHHPRYHVRSQHSLCDLVKKTIRAIVTSPINTPSNTLSLSTHPVHPFLGNGAHLQKIGKMEKIESENNLDVKSHTSKRRIR